MSTPAPEGGPHQHPEVEQSGTSNPVVDPLDPIEEPSESTELTEEQKKIAADAARGIYGSGYGYGEAGTGALGNVGDPDKVFAQITRQEYLDYVKNFREFEQELIQKATTDTSLIDYAREDAATSAERTSQIAQRNLSRYGAALTPAQQQEMQRSINRGTTLGGIQSVSDARIAQRDANQKLLGDLINIGQGVNRTSLAQLGSAAQDATMRNNAYKQARASHKAQTAQAVGGLASMAIMAAFMI